MSGGDYHDVAVRRGDDGIPRCKAHGHYRLPDPNTEEVQCWTRATTIASALKDRYGLELWDQRNIVYGMGQRPSLFAMAAACKRTDDKRLGMIAMKAKEAADASSGADLGQALHTFAERVDRGEEFDIPQPFLADIEAYRKTTTAAGIATALGWIERVVVIPSLGVAGMIDRLSNGLWPLPRIGDLKTAADKTYEEFDDETGRRIGTRTVNTVTSYGMADIPLQLALYAHSTHWYDIASQQWVEMPKVDQDWAMVFHVPAGQAECRIYEIDIRAGWEAVQLAFDIRAWRKRKGLFQIVPVVGFSPSDAAAGEGEDEDSDRTDLSPSPSTIDATGAPHPERFAEVHARVEAIKAHSDQARQWLAARWPATIRTFPKGGPQTAGELARIAEICERTEAQFSIEIAQRGTDGASNRSGTGKGGEESPLSSEDPPAPRPDSHNDGGQGEIDFRARKAWVHERVEAIKAADVVDGDDTPRNLLASLWSSRDEIPRFPKGGPRDADELDAVIGMCDLVEMRFEMPFGPTDPTLPKSTKQTRKESR